METTSNADCYGESGCFVFELLVVERVAMRDSMAFSVEAVVHVRVDWGVAAQSQPRVQVYPE